MPTLRDPRKRDAASAAQADGIHFRPPHMKERGPRRALRAGAGNMLPAIFLPIAYVPLVNWITGLMG